MYDQIVQLKIVPLARWTPVHPKLFLRRTAGATDSGGRRKVCDTSTATCFNLFVATISRVRSGNLSRIHIALRHVAACQEEPSADVRNAKRFQILGALASMNRVSGAIATLLAGTGAHVSNTVIALSSARAFLAAQ